MKNPRPNPRTLAGFALAALIGLGLGGCATYYPAGDRGVYYEVPEYRPSRAAYIDPFVYPYWSLDYFYYSRYYHPYSVVVHRYDPWYYPYPGWYYGYRPGPRFAGHHRHFHYPWHRYGDHYAGYRPWYSGIHLGFGHYGHHRGDRRHRVRELDARLHELETRRSLAVRSQRPDRELMPAAGPWVPATGRGAAVRRGDLPRLPRDGRGGDAGDRASERQALLQRLRAAGRDAPLPGRSERYRDRPPVAPVGNREVLPRRGPATEPVSPGRQRAVTPSPPRSRPQRQPSREPDRPVRSRSGPQRDEPSRRERR